MMPFGVGVSPDTPWVQDVIRHEQTGLLIEPETGTVYGRGGAPVGAVCRDGYVRLGARHGSMYLYAHRVIWEAVHGPIPAGLQIDHLNGRKADNRVCNLEPVTQSQNVQRAVLLGLAPVGEQRREAKLTEALVREIRATADTISSHAWAKRLGVDGSTIRQARDGKTWRHVPLRGRAAPMPQKRAARRHKRRP